MSSSDVAEKDEKNARGIPQAPFIGDVEEYLGANPNVENALKDLQTVLACVLRIPIRVHVMMTVWRICEASIDTWTAT